MTKQNKNRISPISVGLKQSTLPLSPSADERLDIAALETWLWDAACAIRGATDAPKFKDFILPLIFYKRLSDVFDDGFYDNDPWGRFDYGKPPKSSADWGWAQHILASLNDPATGSGQAGRAAIVLDTGAVSRGSGSQSSNREKTIRQKFVEADVIEGDHGLSF